MQGKGWTKLGVLGEGSGKVQGIKLKLETLRLKVLGLRVTGEGFKVKLKDLDLYR